MALELNGTTGVSLVQDGVVQTADLADDAVTAAKLFSGFANGVTSFSRWYLNTDFTAGADPVINWTEDFAVNGSFTESSGTFTFPSTGYWYITGFTNGSAAEGTRYHRLFILTTTNNSTYTAAVENFGNASNYDGQSDYNGVSFSYIFDVQDTSTHKMRFKVDSANSSWVTRSGSSQTYWVAMRLGDT